MIEGIPAWVGDLGAPGLLAIVVLLVLTGRLLSARQSDRMLTDKAQEAAEWRSAFKQQQQINGEFVAQLRAVASGQETIVSALESLPRPSERTPT